MANGVKEDRSRGGRGRRRIYHGNTRVPWVVMGSLAVFLGAVAILVGALKKPPGPTPGVRAVVVPTTDRERIIVVPPCDTGVRITARNAAAQLGTPGSTAMALPKETGSRTVLIPQCASAIGASPPGTRPPSVALVLPTRTVEPGQAFKKLAPEAQLIVPAGSPARLVVVPACTKRAKQDRVLGGPAGGGARTVIAPAC